jgi:hypothetical protein
MVRFGTKRVGASSPFSILEKLNKKSASNMDTLKILSKEIFFDYYFPSEYLLATSPQSMTLKKAVT